jgi:hypothetical protein
MEKVPCGRHVASRGHRHRRVYRFWTTVAHRRLLRAIHSAPVHRDGGRNEQLIVKISAVMLSTRYSLPAISPGNALHHNAEQFEHQRGAEPRGCAGGVEGRRRVDRVSFLNRVSDFGSERSWPFFQRPRQTLIATSSAAGLFSRWPAGGGAPRFRPSRIGDVGEVGDFSVLLYARLSCLLRSKGRPSDSCRGGWKITDFTDFTYRTRRDAAVGGHVRTDRAWRRRPSCAVDLP